MDELPQIKAVVGSLVGSVASFPFFKGMTTREKLFVGAIAGAVAWFVGEAVEVHFNSGGLSGVAGLTIGLFGRTLCESIYPYLQKDFITDIRKRIGGE